MTFTRPPSEKVEPVTDSELMSAYSVFRDVNPEIELITKPERGYFEINIF